MRERSRLTHCQAVAHHTDVVAQQIHHAFISDRHLELICLLLELTERAIS
jgi:hypothetical protein